MQGNPLASTCRITGALVVCAIFALPLLVCARKSEADGKRVLTETVEWRDDFRGDGLGQWASYPPAQDIGYEPSLTPTTDYGSPTGRALMRVVKPNRVGPQRFGFIKKVNIKLTADSVFQFGYQLKSPRGSEEIEIGLAATDGNLYRMKLTAKTNQWSTGECSLAQLKAPVGVDIEAVYIVANVANADPDLIYRFMIYSVALSGLREARFSIDTPSSAAIEPWSSLISAQSYRRGDTIMFTVRSGAKLIEAECTLQTQTSKTIATAPLYNDGTHGDVASGDNIWTNNQLHRILPSDPSGVWVARLHGSTANKESLSTDVRLLVQTDRDGVHPRLFFGAGDREKLVARTLDPKFAALWTHVLTTAKSARASGDLAHGGETFELLDSEYLLPSLLGYFDVLNRARSRIAYNAMEAYLTGNSEARNAAKSAMLDVARWSRWEPPWFRAHGQYTYYPAGLLAADVALGYDLLYNDLSETERVLIRRALIEKSIIPTYKEYVADNRAMANTSNWIAHTVGGALMAAASIADDLSDKERTGSFEISIGGLMRKLEDHVAASYLPDGSYGEGISYHEFDAETLGPALVALERVFGVDYWNQTHVSESLTYPLYTLVQPLSAVPDMGDTHPPAGHGIPAIAYHSKDPVVRWYYSQFDRPSLAKFIFYDDSVAPSPPKLPTSRVFHDKGNAVFRSGWGPEDMVLLFRAGPNFNHHHADQGSFLLSAFGEVLISEAGWSDYYKDPYYATFFTQAIGHNTILVGGNPESQTIPDTLQFKALKRYPRITDSLTSEFYDGVQAELSSVYQNRLLRYVRQIVFVKPDYFIVFDDLMANGRPEVLDSLLHLPNRDKVKVADLTATYTAEKGTLVVRSFPSSMATATVKDGRIPYQVFSTRTPADVPEQPVYLDFKTVKPVSDAQFLTAIVPAKSESAAASLSKQITENSGEFARGVRVLRGGKTDLVMFRVGPLAKMIVAGRWSAEAASLVVTESGDVLERFAVQQARSLNHGERRLFSSTSPVSIAANLNSNEVEVVCSSAEAAKVSLLVANKPTRILMDGKEMSSREYSFSASSKTISFDLPIGQHELKISIR